MPFLFFACLCLDLCMCLYSAFVCVCVCRCVCMRFAWLRLECFSGKASSDNRRESGEQEMCQGYEARLHPYHDLGKPSQRFGSGML